MNKELSPFSKWKNGFLQFIGITVALSIFFIGLLLMYEAPRIADAIKNKTNISETTGLITEIKIKERQRLSRYTTNRTEYLNIKIKNSDQIFKYNDKRIKYSEIKDALHENEIVTFLHDDSIIYGIKTQSKWLLSWEEAKKEQRIAPLFYFGLSLIFMYIGWQLGIKNIILFFKKLKRKSFK